MTRREKRFVKKSMMLVLNFKIVDTNYCCASILLFFQVTSRYYWAKVLEDNETVKRWDVCQRTSKKFEKPSAQLLPLRVRDTVWHRIGIDLVGPQLETSRRNKYFITCTCYFSKWPEAAPLTSKSAEATVISDVIINI